jgi:hypothetical protein
MGALRRGLILGTGTRARSGDPTTGGQANQRQRWHSARRTRASTRQSKAGRVGRLGVAERWCGGGSGVRARARVGVNVEGVGAGRC